MNFRERNLSWREKSSILLPGKVSSVSSGGNGPIDLEIDPSAPPPPPVHNSSSIALDWLPSVTPGKWPLASWKTSRKRFGAHSREGLCQHWAIRQDAPPPHSPLHLARVCGGDRRKVASVEGDQSRLGGEKDSSAPTEILRCKGFFQIGSSVQFLSRRSLNFGDVETYDHSSWTGGGIFRLWTYEGKFRICLTSAFSTWMKSVWRIDCWEIVGKMNGERIFVYLDCL